MFDILEADIVVMQELKIQRKDLRDDMVLVPGWDVYLSLPKHLKGNSRFPRMRNVVVDEEIQDTLELQSILETQFVPQFEQKKASLEFLHLLTPQ
jgi:exonuclease III